MASIEFPLSFTRQFVGPLDTSAVYSSLLDLQEYVNNSPIAYIGQVISIASGDDAGIYIIGDDGGGGKTFEKYSNSNDLSSKADSSDLTNHTGRIDNPHAVTATQVGLSAVENTALSTWSGSNSITTVGTLTDLTVSGQTTFTNDFPNLPSGSPTNPNHAASKSYVDALAEGLHTHDQVHALSLSELSGLLAGSVGSSTISYDNGTGGVGSTLTIDSAGEFDFLSPIVWDNDTDISLGDRVLVNNQDNIFENGIYEITSSTVLTRASDFDIAAEMAGGDFVFVTHGDTYNNTGWVLSEAVTAVGTDDIHFIQFSGAGSFIGGHGITIDGNEVSIPKNELIELQDLTISGDLKLITDPLPNANDVLTTDANGLASWQTPIVQTLDSVTTNGATTVNDIEVGRIVTAGNTLGPVETAANSIAIGGTGNSATGAQSEVLGGGDSTASGTGSTIVGGNASNNVGNWAIIAGGRFHTISVGARAGILGGEHTTVTHADSVMLGVRGTDPTNKFSQAIQTAHVDNLHIFEGGFKMPTGAVADYVLTTDANGVGTWQEAAGGAVSDAAYSIDWDGVLNVAPSKNAVYDKIQDLIINSGGSTNLTISNKTASSLDILSDTGTGVTITGADATFAGLLTSADFTKLDLISIATESVDLNALSSTVAGITSNIPSNLSYTASATNGVIGNSDGDGFTIPVADTINAGLLKPADFDKLGLISIASTSVDLNTLSSTVAGITSNIPSNLSYTASTGIVSNSDGDGFTIPVANTDDPGLLTSADFDKLGLISIATSVNLNALADEVEVNTGKVSNVTTNLSYIASTRTVTSSDGEDAVITLADTNNAGLLTNTDFNKLALISIVNPIDLDNIAGSQPDATTTIKGITRLATVGEVDEVAAPLNTVAVTPASLANLKIAVATNSGKDSNVSTDLGIGARTISSLEITSSDGTNATLPPADTDFAGLLTKEDFDKLSFITVEQAINLDNIPTGGGDMLKIDYDPFNVNGDAFLMENMVEGGGLSKRIYTNAEKEKVLNLWSGKNNLGSLTSPTVSDDTTLNYSVGSIWINTSDGSVYTCVNSTVGGAVWSETSLSGLATVATTGSASDLSGTLSIERIANGTITEDKLAAGVKTDLASAQTSLQPAAIGVTVQGFSSILNATTASFLTQDKEKLNNIVFNDPRDPGQINLDTLSAAVTLNTAKVSADGSVTTHSDISAVGSGSIITTLEREKLGRITALNAINLDTLSAAVTTNSGKVSNIQSNLAYTASATQGSVTNSDGTGFVITAADGTNAGLLKPADFDKLGNITITQPVNLDDLEDRINTLDASVVLKGIWDPTSGSFPSNSLAGFSYIVSADGTVDGITFNTNDRLISLVDGASATTYDPNWYKADYTDQVLSVNGSTGTVVLNTDNISAIDATNKYVSGDDLTKLSNITVTQAVNLDTIESNVNLNNDKVSNVSTNLAYTASATNGTVTSSDGDNAILPAADTINAGLLKPADFDKLGNITVSTSVNLTTLAAEVAANTGKVGNFTHTGEVTGEFDLILQPEAINNKPTLVGPLSNNDFVLISDADDVVTLKKVNTQAVADLAKETPGLNTTVQDITSSGGSVTFNAAIGSNARIILTEDVSSINITNLINGDTGIIFIKQNATGSWTFNITDATTRVYSGDLSKIPDITPNTVGSATVGYAFDSGELHLYVSEVT